jgi:hypothetical protein
MGDQPFARFVSTHRTTPTQYTHTIETSLASVRFEPTIPALGRAKKVHSLDQGWPTAGTRVVM